MLCWEWPKDAGGLPVEGEEGEQTESWELEAGSGIDNSTCRAWSPEFHALVPRGRSLGVHETSASLVGFSLSLSLLFFPAPCLFHQSLPSECYGIPCHIPCGLRLCVFDRHRNTWMMEHNVRLIIILFSSQRLIYLSWGATATEVRSSSAKGERG